jgi:hypothetical protein
MSPVGFELTVSAGELPQTYALDRAANGTGCKDLIVILIKTCVGGSYIIMTME